MARIDDMLYPAALEQRIQELEEQLKGVLNCVQRYQPVGSPPPGDSIVLTEWVFTNLETQLAIRNAEIVEREKAAAAWGNIGAEFIRECNAKIERLREGLKRLEQVVGVISERYLLWPCCGKLIHYSPSQKQYIGHSIDCGLAELLK